MKRSISPTVLRLVTVIITYGLTRVIYRTTEFPFTTLADQSAVLRFGADLAMWLILFTVIFRLLSLVAARVSADRRPPNQ
jgi:hypothetical protein